MSPGATVALNGNAVPVLAATYSQIDVQVPYESVPGDAAITVTVPCGTTPGSTITVAPAAPYLKAAVNDDGSPNNADHPAKAGGTITVTLTGAGAVDPPVATGAAALADPVSRATLAATASIGAADAAVQSVVLTPGAVGWAQAKLTVPELAAGPYPVVLTVGGVASNPVTVYLQ